MKKRVITAIVALVLFIPVLILHRTFLFTAVMALLSAVAVWELTNCINSPTKLRFWGTIVGAIIPILADKNITKDVVSELFRRLSLPIALFSIAVLIMAYHFMPKKQFLPMYLVALLYPSTAFGLIVSYERIEAYPMLFLMFFITSWVTDTFAMLIGSKFGKRKLCPFLSPKKTIEGSIGGTIAAVIAFIIYGYFTNTPFIESAFLGLILSIAAQSGDLLASGLKRAYNIKDFGKIFPGHGGVVDRFDSVLLTAHIFNLYMIFSLLLI